MSVFTFMKGFRKQKFDESVADLSDHLDMDGVSLEIILEYARLYSSDHRKYYPVYYSISRNKLL